MSELGDNIGGLTTHVSNVLDGTEQFEGISDKRAKVGGRPNLRVTMSQILAYILANGAGGLSSQADKTVLGNNSGAPAVPTALDQVALAKILGTPMSAAPGTPTIGMLVIADGLNGGFDPLGRRDGVPYAVEYDGVAWVPPNPFNHPGFVGPQWYMFGGSRVTVGGAALSANVVHLFPFMVWRRMTLSDAGARITTLSATGNVRISIWASLPATHMPTGTGVGGSVILSTAGTGPVSGALSANAVLTPGLYWYGVHADANAGSAIFMCPDTSTISGSCSHLIGASSFANLWNANSGLVSGYTAPATYASGVPDLTGAVFTPSGNDGNPKVPMVGFKVASVP